MVFVTGSQFVVFTTRFCCNPNPVEGAGHATTAVLVVVRKMRNKGAPGV